MFFITFLIIYVLSIFWLRHETILEYQQEKYSFIRPGALEMVMCLVPVFNTIGAIVSFTMRKIESKNIAKKFFKK